MGQGPSAVPIAPAWLVSLIAGALILIVLGHMSLVVRRERIAVRRRLRVFNGALMLAGVLAGAYGLAGVAPASGQPFVLAWTLTMALAGAVVIVAMADMVVTLRLRRLAQELLRKRLHADVSEGRRGEESRDA